MRILSAALAALFLFSACAKKKTQNHDFTRLFEGRSGTIAVHDPETGILHIHNAERARERFSPFSTFKIASSVIFLEEGLLKNPDEVYEWEDEVYPRTGFWLDSWNGRHNLRSAFKHSVVPFYRSLAMKAGEKAIGHYIKKFSYGNQDISSGPDSFWLGGSLSISAEEQVIFIENLYYNRYKLKPETIASLKEIMVYETGEDYILSGKTGAGSLPDQEKAIGWFTGYLKSRGKVWFFSVNIDGKDFKDVLQPRINTAKAVLKELGAY